MAWLLRVFLQHAGIRAICLLQSFNRKKYAITVTSATYFGLGSSGKEVWSAGIGWTDHWRRGQRITRDGARHSLSFLFGHTSHLKWHVLAKVARARVEVSLPQGGFPVFSVSAHSVQV